MERNGSPAKISRWIPAAEPRPGTQLRSPSHHLAATLLAAAMLAAVTPPSAAAQPAPMADAGAGAAMETYHFEEVSHAGPASVSLLTLPVSVSGELRPWLRLEVTGEFARGTLTRRDGSEIRLAAWTDTEVRLTLPIGRDAVTLAAIALLPSGKLTHAANEAELAAIVAADLLPFRISNWGSGGGFGGSTTVAHRVGATGIGVTVGFLTGREIETLETGEVAYRPGNQLSVQAAVDRAVGTAARASLIAAYHGFSGEPTGGANLYRSGDRYQAVASLAFAAGRQSSGLVYAGVQHRERYSPADPGWGTGLAQQPAEFLVLAGLGIRVPALGGVLMPTTDARWFRGVGGSGQGYGLGVGGQAEWRVRGVTLAPTFSLRFGTLPYKDGAPCHYFGAEAGAAIRFDVGSG